MWYSLSFNIEVNADDVPEALAAAGDYIADNPSRYMAHISKAMKNVPLFPRPEGEGE